MRVVKGNKSVPEYKVELQKGENFQRFFCTTHTESATSNVHTHSLSIELINDPVNTPVQAEL